jgi:hypothetical protein
MSNKTNLSGNFNRLEESRVDPNDTEEFFKSTQIKKT